MALKIRLTRLGDNGSPFYRVVVAESRKPRDGKFIAVLGTFDPKTNDPSGIKIDRDATIGWLAKGAVPTDTVQSLLVKAAIVTAEKYKAKPNAKSAAPKIKKEKK